MLSTHALRGHTTLFFPSTISTSSSAKAERLRCRMGQFWPKVEDDILQTSHQNAIDPACIDHYARIVSEWTKDNTVSFGLRDMIRRFRDCLGC